MCNNEKIMMMLPGLSLRPSNSSRRMLTSLCMLPNSRRIILMQLLAELLGSKGGSAWSPSKKASLSALSWEPAIGAPSTEWFLRHEQNGHVFLSGLKHLQQDTVIRNAITTL